MSRIHIDIPEALNTRINESLAFSQLDHRDKGRLFLYAIDRMLKDPLPDDFKEQCKIAKDAIRERQKKRYQERMQA